MVKPTDEETAVIEKIACYAQVPGFPFNRMTPRACETGVHWGKHLNKSQETPVFGMALLISIGKFLQNSLPL